MEKRAFIIGAGLAKKHLTPQAREVLRKSDIILYDRLIDSSVLSSFRAEKIYAGKRAGESLKQRDINNKMLALISRGKVVARLKCGDPFLFGRGFEECTFLKKHGVNVSVIPGISAFSALSELGIPLTHRSHSHSVSMITGSRAGKGKLTGMDADTLVFYMGVSNLEQIVRQIRKPKNTPCLVIENAFRPYQRIINGNLGNIVHLAGMSCLEPPALVVVGNSMKLYGNDAGRMLSFRQKERAKETGKIFSNLKNVPLFKVVPRKIGMIKADIFAFTSPNAVKSVFEQVDINGKFVAIGERTRRELSRYGKRARVPEKQNTDGLMELLEKEKGEKRVFCSVYSGMKKIKKVIAYDIVFQKKKNIEKEIMKADTLLITSSEILKYLVRRTSKKLLNKKKIWVIGPVTAAESGKQGVRVDYVLEKPLIS